jgi:hypothetical protein
VLVEILVEAEQAAKLPFAGVRLDPQSPRFSRVNSEPRLTVDAGPLAVSDLFPPEDLARGDAESKVEFFRS